MAKGPTSADDSKATPSESGGDVSEVLASADVPALEACPACTYRLVGLPRSHRCPECGIEYDEHTRVWQDRNPWRVTKVLAVIVFGYCFGVCLYSFFRVSPGDAAARCAWSIGMLVMAALFVRQLALTWRRDFVAVTPRGVLVRLQAFKTRTLPWEDVVEVGLDVLGTPGRTTLFYRGKGHTRYVTIRWVLHSSAERGEFARAVEEGRSRYGPSANDAADGRRRCRDFKRRAN